MSESVDFSAKTMNLEIYNAGRHFFCLVLDDQTLADGTPELDVRCIEKGVKWFLVGWNFVK